MTETKRAGSGRGFDLLRPQGLVPGHPEAPALSWPMAWRGLAGLRPGGQADPEEGL